MHLIRQLGLAVLCACAWACQTADEPIGSACAEGVCSPQAASEPGMQCLVGNSAGSVGLLPPGTDLPKLCLPRALLTDADGLVSCNVVWNVLDPQAGLEAVGLTECGERPFLEPGPVDAMGHPGCRVRQLTTAEQANGSKDGWFYSALDDCPRIEFTSAAMPMADVVGVQFQCVVALGLDAHGERTDRDVNLCASVTSGSAKDVGAQCLPTVIPEGGFDPREAYFEVGSPDCISGCLVYQLEGDPSPDCSPASSCTPQAEIADKAHCSCRCDVPEGESGPECACPDGFFCVEALQQPAPSGLRGGYCVRNSNGSQ